MVFFVGAGTGAADLITVRGMRLLEQAEGISRSPQFLRELILNGRRKGLNSRQIAKNAGLSVDEVDLILAQEVQ